jgi:serine/threonine protein kinase
VAQGLHRAHKQGLIHRDVKPDNILVTPDGQAKLADLGLVKEVDADLNLTRTGRGLGTPHFMAPEQFRNAKNADIRCDIYSLGATLYQMVTGELPFKSNGPLDAWMKKMHNDLVAPRQLVPTLSERLDWAIRRAMSPQPEDRPMSCREFVEDLTGHSTRKPTAPGAPPADNPPATPAAGSGVLDLWYLVYKDELGVTHTVKGGTAAIRRSLREGLLGDASNVRASRSKAGPFEPLRGFPEFRDLVLQVTPINVPAVTPGPTPAAPPPGNSGVLGRSGGMSGSGPASSKRMVPTPAAPPPPEPEDAPHIAFGPSRRPRPASHPKWLEALGLALLLVVVAAISAAVAFFFFLGN